MRTAGDHVRELPAWPVYVLFAGYPIWWFFGAGAFAVALIAIPMALLLVQRPDVEIPMAFFLFIGFVIWACAAAIELSGGPKLIGFGVRMANYAGSAVVFVYLYNGRDRLSSRHVLGAVAVFFGVVVAGGYLGMLVPRGSLSTPLETILPPRIGQNAYVHALVHPSFSEAQHPWGSPRTFYRPSAPFAYKNSWGCNFALLVPLMVAGLLRLKRPTVRFAMAALLAAAALPAFATLNRGMFLALGLVLSYVAIRLALRGQLVPLVSLVGIATTLIAVALSLGVMTTLQERLHFSHSTLGREASYREAFDGAMSSPIFGHGAPQASESLTVATGTQGQVWNVMFSYGFVALACFLGWFAVVASSTWKTRDHADLWVHGTLLVALTTFFFYGYDGIQLAVAMTAAALALRSRRPRLATTVSLAAPPPPLAQLPFA